MATSGTTGIPKLINHSFSSLIRSTSGMTVKEFIKMGTNV